MLQFMPVRPIYRITLEFKHPVKTTDMRFCGQSLFVLRHCHLFELEALFLLNMSDKNNFIPHTFVCLLICLSILPDFAYSQFMVSPVIIEETGYPGGIRTFTVSLSNSGRESLNCSISVSAMDISGNGLPIMVENSPRSCSSWITAASDTFSLAPKDGRKLVFTMRIPRDTGGGYYAIISCQGTPATGTEATTTNSGVGAGIKFSHRSLVPVLLTVPAPQMQAVIEATEPIITKSVQGSGYLFKLPIRNRGNVHARMTGTVEIRSEANQFVDRFDMVAGRGFILPDHERLFENKASVNLPDGVYQMRVRLDVRGSGRPMQNAFPFFIKDGIPEVRAITDELRQSLQKESAGFIVSPAELNISLQPGGRRSQAIELVNLAREKIEIQAQIMQWYRRADGNDMITDANVAHNRSGLENIELREDKIILRPLSRRRLPIAVSLARQAVGETYAAVTFDRLDIQLDNSSTGRVRRSTRICLYAQGTGNINSEITQLQAVRRQNGVVDLILRYRNTGNIGFIPDISFRILDENDSELGKIVPANRPMFVQAGGDGRTLSAWEKVLDPGQYTVEATFRPSQNMPPVVERTEFVIPSVSK